MTDKGWNQEYLSVVDKEVKKGKMMRKVRARMIMDKVDDQESVKKE